MIQESENRTAIVNGALASGEFGISLSDSAHIMTILRDTLYSDKILAVLREYASNAWDANRDAGKHDIPIEIHLPTHEDRTLSISDSGKGLSEEDVFNIYTLYGRSTKRNTNDAVGMLGIGSKSAFAYTDSFTITSCHNGTKSTYVAMIDKTEKGVVNLLHREPCGDKTGVTISFMCEKNDINLFKDRAKYLFEYFNPLPKFNYQIFSDEDIQRQKSLIELGNARVSFNTNTYYHNNSWIAIMGCIPYRINLSQINIPDFYKRLSGIIYLNIGDVQIAASREDLKYSNTTKKKLEDTFEQVTSNIILYVSNKLASASDWQKRIIINSFDFIHSYSTRIFDQFKFPTIKRDELKLSKIKESPSQNTKTRIVIRDDKRALSGYNLSDYDVLLTRIDNDVSWKDVLSELDAWLIKFKLKGIPVIQISSLPYQKVVYEKIKNEKHKQKMFLFAPKLRQYENQIQHPYSQHWECVDHFREDDDVYIEINSFKPIKQSFFQHYLIDIEVAKAFNIQLPKVFGYKTKNIDDAKKCIEYYTWRNDFYKKIYSSKLYKDYNNINDMIGSSGYYNTRILDATLFKQWFNNAVTTYGDNHIITKFFKMRLDIVDIKFDKSLLRKIMSIFTDNKSEIACQFENINKTYPMLSFVGYDFTVHNPYKLVTDNKIMEYIHLVDNQKKEEKNDDK